MIRALEVLLVAAALVLAGFVAIHLMSRRGAAPSVLSPKPGPDVKDPSAPPNLRPVPSAVKGLPMIKLTVPPRRRPRAVDVPPAP